MKKAYLLKWSISATLSLTGIILTVLLSLIQFRIWNGSTGHEIQDTLLSCLAPDALLNKAARDLSRPPSVYFNYGHYFIVIYLLLIAAVWVSNYKLNSWLKNVIILLLSFAATATIFIYWVGEYLTVYARELFSNYIEIPAIGIGLVLLTGFAFKSQQRIITYPSLLVFLVTFLFTVLFSYIPQVLVLASLIISLLLSLTYSVGTGINLGKRNWATGIVPFATLLLLAIAFTVFAFIHYKPNVIPGKHEQVPPLNLPNDTGLKVFILNTGFNRMSKALSPGNPIWRPAPVFLIHHPKYGYTLFDCGISKDVATKGQGAMPFPMPLLFESKSSVDKLIATQLIRYGISTDSIKTIILSHLHEDHTGGLAFFKKARVVVHTNTHVQTTDLALFNASSFTQRPKVIGNTFDLLGDSTLLLIESEGHTKDDLMLLVAAANGPVLLTGDAVVHFDWLNSNDIERLPENPEGAARVRNSIRQLVKANKNLVLLPGHDIPIIPSDRNDVIKLFPEQFILNIN